MEGHVEGGLRKSIAGGAHLAGGNGVTRTIDIREGGVGDEGKLGGVTNHLEVSALLLGCHGELVPDVHPITVLAVNALATNLDLNLGDELLSGVVEPAGIDAGRSAGKSGGVAHELVNLGESNLEVGAVSKITVAADNAGNTATEVGLAVEGLLDRLNSKVGVTSVGHLPEGDLGISSKIDILSAVGHELHKSASHFYTIPKEKNFLILNLINY